MKKVLLPLLTVILCIVILSRCSVNDDFLNAESVQKTNFPAHVEVYGETFAKELRQSINNLNTMGVDYSDADKTPEFRERFYKDWCSSHPTLRNSNLSMDQIGLTPEEFIEGYRNLTSTQIKFINRIIDEGQKTASYSDLFNLLIDINKDIYAEVPKIEQERLLYTTAVLYYGLKEIQNLEKQGQMLLTPSNKVSVPLLKTSSESGGSFGETCKKFLAVTWTIAIGEPTPAGEIVASVITVVVGGYILYEVITCTLNAADCIKKFDECVSSGMASWKCTDCLRYCQAQQKWDCPRSY